MNGIVEALVDENTLKEYCGKDNSPLHPNRISALGGLSTMVGTTLLSNPYTAPVGVIAIAAGDILADHYDGKFARRFGNMTKQGARLDPLFDKIKNMSVGTYATIVEGITNPLSLLFGASIMVDVASQRVGRGPLLEQIVEAYHAVKSPEDCTPDNEEKSSSRAVIAGKIKTGTQTGVHIAYGLKETGLLDLVGIEQFIDYSMQGALGISIVLASVGIYQRYQNSKN